MDKFLSAPQKLVTSAFLEMSCSRNQQHFRITHGSTLPYEKVSKLF